MERKGFAAVAFLRPLFFLFGGILPQVRSGQARSIETQPNYVKGAALTSKRNRREEKQRIDYRKENTPKK
jgi:hypothetical protein